MTEGIFKIVWYTAGSIQSLPYLLLHSPSALSHMPFAKSIFLKEEEGQHHLTLYMFRATLPVFLYYPLPPPTFGNQVMFTSSSQFNREKECGSRHGYCCKCWPRIHLPVCLDIQLRTSFGPLNLDSPSGRVPKIKLRAKLTSHDLKKKITAPNKLFW